MKLLLTLNPENATDDSVLQNQKTARAVLLDGSGNIALMHISKFGYHKLPGGGVEEGESIEGALRRECLEETGCEISIKEPLGRIVEYRKRYNLKQESFAYIAHVVEKKSSPQFEAGEIEEGSELVWIPLSQALELIKSENPGQYEGTFIVKREIAFLTEAMNLWTNA